MDNSVILKKIDDIEDKIKSVIGEYFPKTYGKYSVSISEISFTRPELFNFEHEVSLKDKDSSLNGKMNAKISITDVETKRVLYSAIKPIAVVPYLTNRGTYIIGGIEKIITNQMTLKPGVYTFDNKGSVKSYSLTEKGQNFDFKFDPETLDLSFNFKGHKFNAIIFLEILGISQSKITEAIGDTTLAEQLIKKTTSKKLDAEALNFWSLMPAVVKSEHRSGKFPSPEVAMEDIRKYFSEVVDFGPTGADVMKLTLGHSTRIPDETLFLNTISKIVNIARAETDVAKEKLSDDRDDIRFQNILTDGDQISYYIRRSLEEITDKEMRSFKPTDNPLPKISVGVVSKELNKFMLKASLVDQVEQTNPLLMSSAHRRLTSMGERGISARAATSETRNLQTSAFGKIDPVETPESGKIGLVTHTASDAVIDGMTLKNRYYKVTNGVFNRDQKSSVLLGPLEEFDKYIAFYNVNTFIKSGNMIKLPKTVMVRHSGEVMDVPSDDVDYVDINPHTIWGDATRLIPFSAHNDGNRMLMGSNMQKQALVLSNRQAPLVQNAVDEDRDYTYEQQLADNHSFVVRASEDGTVKSVTNKKLVVTNNKGVDEEHPLMSYFPLNMSNFINNVPVVSAGDKVKKGQLLADGWQTKDGVNASGINARIAYMPWKGYNFEDGYVVSSSFAKKMTTEEIKEIFVEVPQHYIGGTGEGDEVIEILRQMNYPSDILSALDSNGVIKKGAAVVPGTILVAMVQEDTRIETRPEYKLLLAMSANLGKNYRNKSETITGYVNGEVLRTVRVPGNADTKEAWKVTIIMRKPLQEGDKLAGRHGNKGVITLIEEDEAMPLAEDGEPIDIIYSPLGVPSRKNLGQLYEVNAGLIASKQKKPFKVFNFDKSETKRVEDGLKEIGYPDGKMTVSDPENGKPFDNKVTVGVAYIMKLKHKVDDKIQARTWAAVNRIYNTPVKETGAKAGEKRNPQKWGEMELRALQASKSVELMEEATKYKSDAAGDVGNRKAIFNALAFGGLDSVAGKTPESLNIFRDYATALGMNVRAIRNNKVVQSLDEKYTALSVAPLRASEVKKLSNGLVHKAGMFTAKVSGDKPDSGGLFDPKIFGETPEEQRSFWGHIDLAIPLPNPFFFSSNANPYTALTGIKQADIEKMLTEAVVVITKPGDSGYKVGEIVYAEDADVQEAAGKKFEFEIGGKYLYSKLKELDIDSALAETQKSLMTTKPAGRESLYKKLRMLKMLQNEKLKPEDLMLTSIPVPPTGLRPFKVVGNKQLNDDANEFYKTLLQVNNKAIKLNKKETFYITENKTKFNVLRDLYRGLENVMGTNVHPVVKNDKELKGYSKKLANKEGLIRGRMMSKYLDYSGRSVIIVNPSLDLDEVGIPVDMAAKLYQPFIMRELFRTQKAGTPADAAKMSRNINDPNTWEALQAAIKERPVILNRAPSLHQFSLQAFNPTLTKSRAIELNPLIVSGFNADFDGDQMGVHVPLTSAAVNEARSLMLPSNNLINPTNGALIAVIKGEAILGLYYMTVDKHKNVILTREMAKAAYTNNDVLLRDYKKGDIKVHDVVLFNNVPQTVGQHLVNNVLPVEYRDFKRVLNSKTATEVIEKILEKEKGGNKIAATILNTWKNLGFLSATKSSLSIGVVDMKSDPKKADILAEVNSIAHRSPEKALEMFYNATEELEKRTGDVLGAENPVTYYMKSGAKGNKKQITRMSTVVGLSRDITGKIVPYGVQGSFKDGLSPGEMWVHAFDSRRGLADRYLSVAEPGELTRDIWSSTQETLITESDCGDVDGIVLPLTSTSIVGRVLAHPVRATNGTILFRRGSLIDVSTRDEIREKSVDKNVFVRSPMRCKATKGVCQKCYGVLPGYTTLPDLGEPVGVLASQAVGEPTAQGVMRTFHGGGVNLSKKELSSVIPRVGELFNMSDSPESKSILSPFTGRVVSIVKEIVTKNINIETLINGHRVLKPVKLHINAIIIVKPGDYVNQGDRLTQEDGSIDPHELLKHRGLKETQEYVVDSLDKLLNDDKVTTDRKHIELAIGKLTDKVVIDENAASPWEIGQVVPLNQITAWNEQNAGTKMSVEIDEITKLINNTASRTYKAKNGSIIIRSGDVITAETVDNLKALGIKKVDIYAKSIEASPAVYGVKNNPFKGNENWFSQLGFMNIKQPFSEGALFGMTDLLDEPRSRTMVGKKLNIGAGYKEWHNEYEDMKKKLDKDHIGNLF